MEVVVWKESARLKGKDLTDREKADLVQRFVKWKPAMPATEGVGWQEVLATRSSTYFQSGLKDGKLIKLKLVP